jgi:hypothetical protein
MIDGPCEAVGKIIRPSANLLILLIKMVFDNFKCNSPAAVSDTFPNNVAYFQLLDDAAVL